MIKLNGGSMIGRVCTALLLWVTAAIVLPAQTAPGVLPAPAPAIALAQTFTTLHSFDYTDGANPYAGLLQSTDGKLYGTTYYGGSDHFCSRHLGCGTVFKITPEGTLTTIYNFGTDGRGQEPWAGLVQATDGSFYGTTTGPHMGGTIFKITDGTLTTLHRFQGTDGTAPYAGLVQGADGNFYGTTLYGGANRCPIGEADTGCGTVFKITPSGTLTTLYNFDATDGEDPVAGLVQGTDGNFYGTTLYGGANGDGTVFKITPNGMLTTLHSFGSQVGDGTWPDGGLVQGTDGNFYGTTLIGGSHPDFGTVFSITPSGTLTILHSFGRQGAGEGLNPYAGLVQGTDGNFYGTTESGGANGELCNFGYGCGTIFKITTGGKLTTIYIFCSQSNCPDGASPYAGLVQDTNGTLYGATSGGGANGDGTIFSLQVGLGPFVETLPTSATVGAAVKILGTSLTGATSVTFNDVAASFTVVSGSEISTTVPSGATTGTVQVVTAGGTLSSNVPFQVLP
jgi:uncharacterized repeat protein (TIGR03803 family)